MGPISGALSVDTLSQGQTFLVFGISVLVVLTVSCPLYLYGPIFNSTFCDVAKTDSYNSIQYIKVSKYDEDHKYDWDEETN